MKEEENVKILDNENETPEGIFQSKKRYYSFNKYNNINRRYYSPLKSKFINGIKFLDGHIKFYSFLKFLFGIIFLVLPLVLIILISYSENTTKNKYIFFPFFISVSLIISSLLIILVIKINDSCRTFGILNLSYERIYNLKTIKFIFTNLFLLWFLFICEDFVISFNLLKEKVTQSKDPEKTSKIFNEGTYIMRLLFIFLFWDLEKNNNNEYIYNKIGYFEYEDHFFDDFQITINKLFIPIITFCFCGLIKIIFIKTKRGYIYIILFITNIFISFYFLFYDVSKDRIDITNIKETEEYFKDSLYKYFELIPITIIVIILLISNIKISIVDLFRKKYYSYKNQQKNNFVFFLVWFSFIFNTLGYLLFLYVLYDLFLQKIKPDFTIDNFFMYWFMIYLSIFLIFLGYAFPFGHFYFKLLYQSTSFAYFEHIKKNEFYIKLSGNLWNNSILFKKRKRDNSF